MSRLYGNASGAGLPTTALTGITTISGTTYAPVASDSNALLSFTNSAATTITIPAGVFPQGTALTFLAYGTGAVTIQGGSNCTIVSNGAAPAAPILRVQYSMAVAIKMTSSGAETWVVSGDII